MHVFSDATTATSFSVWLLMLLLHTQGNALLPSAPTISDNDDEVIEVLNFFDDAPAVKMVLLLQPSIQNFQFCSAMKCLMKK